MVISYKWIQEYFDEPLPAPDALVELLTLHSFEIEGVEERGDDTLIDIDVLPNRAHDCLSHRGIAREIGSILGRDLHKDPYRDDVLELPEEGIKAEVDSDVPNTSTIAILIKGIAIKESPDWLKERLAVLGQRSINNIVDITNYVMLGTGQPLHAFDAKAFGDGVLRIKRADEGERLTLLGDIKVELTKDDLVVSDGKVALDVAGIRGGEDAEIDESTTDIVLSASHFDPTMVRKTAQRLKLWTDAAKRFQNNPSPHLAEYGAKECLEMILDLAGGEVIGMTRAGEALPEEVKVKLSVERTNNLLGLSLSSDEVVDILKRLGASYEGDDVLTVSIPHERMDLRIEEDLIEEVGRLHGYDKLPELDLPEQDAPVPQKEFAVFEIIRDLLTNEGFSEVYTYSMRNEGKVKLLNALNTEKSFMRTGLVEGLEEALVLNKNDLPLLGKESVDIFEIGNVFTPEEKTYLGIATSRKKKKFDELTSKLSDALGVEIKGKEHGNVFEIELSPVLEKVEDLSLPEYTAPEVQFSIPSAYPFALRDVAVWVPESMEEGGLRKMIASEAGELLYRIDLFDEYTKEGKTSYAYHLVFQSTTETLSDEEVNTIMERVYGALRTQSGFEIR